MRKLIPLAPFVFLLTSCTTYQYMTVRGKNISYNEHRDFVMENDSVLVKYNFNGVNAPVNVEVHNKLGKPIYVDWSRSALIINDKAISYVPNEVPVSGSVTSTSSSFGRPGNILGQTSTSQGIFSGTMGVAREMDFIPPGAFKTKTPLGVTNVFYPDARNNAKRRQIAGGTGYTATVMVREYADTSSPFQFSSYLTIYMEGAPDEPVAIQHSFYVSEIWTTTQGPRNFHFINNKDGDRFYVRTTNAFGKIAGGFGILAGYALVSYGEVKSQEFAEKRGYYQYYR